ncbi:hypothetical protein [Krasilnikovia sp. M28-CT-15]|uniref:hypothetical protein n=1 Tax=Krasilnikovia sp. M28-CT-15 TaxID=3373540 RepID=UPI003876440D
MRVYAQSYTVTVQEGTDARAAADLLAARGHRLVAVRPAVNSTFEPEMNGWWRIFSLVVDPPKGGDLPVEPTVEIKAVGAIARRFRGVMTNSYGNRADLLVRIFNRDGLVHEMSQEESEAVRTPIHAAEPAVAAVVLPEGLRCGPFGARGKVLRAALEAVAQATTDATPAQVRLAPTGYDDAGDLLATLHDQAMHQGTCRAWTAGAAPLFAAIVADERVSDPYVAKALALLYEMASVGRRQMAWRADKSVALGQPEAEGADESAARAAVVAVVPALPAGRSELTDFVLAALAAAVDSTPPPGLDQIARDYPAREPAVALIHSLSTGDQNTIGSALADLKRARPDLVDASESPHAPVEYLALEFLSGLVEWEIGQARTASRRPWLR